MKRILRLVLGIVPFLLSSNLLSQNNVTNFGGYVKFYHHNLAAGSSDYSKTGVRLQLNVSKTFGTKGDLFSSFDFDANDILLMDKGFEQRGAELEIYPVELYGSLYFSNIDIRLGKQFIFWGKTDWINPTDNICPWDYANISSELEDYRLAVTSLKLDWYIQNVTMEMVLVPLFVPHRMPFEQGILSEGNVELGIPGIDMKSPEYPEAHIKNSQVGFRLLSSFWGIDYSLSYYNGHDKNPSMISGFVPQRQFIEIQPQYKPIQIVGGDFERTFGRWSLKGEAAYFLTNDRDGLNIEVDNPHLQYVLGSDFTFSDKLSFNLQWSQDIKDKFNAVLEKSVMTKKQNQSSQSKIASTASFLINWSPFDYISSQLIGVYNLKDRDSFLLGFVNYELSDGINMALGGLFLSGPEDSPFGKMDKEDKVFMEMKFSF